MIVLNKLLKKDALDRFIKTLMEKFYLFGPTEQDNLIFFKEIKKIEDMEFDYSNLSSQPLKTLFLPQTEELCQFKVKRNEIELIESFADEMDKKRIIIGSRACEARALTILDHVFLKWQPIDSMYLKRRENSIIISLLCKSPSPTCYCTSLNPDFRDGSDILMIEEAEDYYLEVITDKGQEVIDCVSHILHPISIDGRVEEAKSRLSSLIKRHVSLDSVAKRLKDSFGDKIWQDVAQPCLGCGVCTYLCPTCYCFDIEDEKARRVRNWDSCSFLSFTKMAAHQPRPELFQRFRNRIMHKFSYFVENFGEIGCVGCSRCNEICPVGIDFIEVIERVIK